ncbi:MAG: PorT family protein [Flavipsychrobacter sp.]|nr:PorT family protein [Flavipsychrobacter sp.]
MKKVLLFVSGAMLLTNVSFAQYDEEPARGRQHGPASYTPWRFGVYIAPNMSWMKPTNSKSNDGMYRVNNDGSKVGFAWGLMADYQFSANYAIETGFNINSTGGIISTSIVPAQIPTGESYISTTVFDYNLQYIEVPFNLKLKSDGIAGGLQLFGQLGASAGVNLSKKATYTINYVDDNGDTRVLTGDRERLTGNLTVSPLLFALNVGGGVEYPIADRLSIYCGVIFNNGFAPDVTNPANYQFDYVNTAVAPRFRDGNTRQNSIALRLGLIF